VDYEAVIGLETHVQLKTKSKMWCGCANEFGAAPNTNVCPVCLGLPGVLPVANEEALRLTALTGLLLIAPCRGSPKFDRKKLFLSRRAEELSNHAVRPALDRQRYIDFEVQRRHRPRADHPRASRRRRWQRNFHFERTSAVDFNRAGVPLLEIVSEPDITSADMAYEYLNALKEILIYGCVSDCDMEKGMVRCDVNVSVRPNGAKALGAKIEIKNMNSFSGVRKALEYEIPRQIQVLKGGGKLVQSTRRWNDVTGVTERLRTKEHAHVTLFL